MKIKSKIIPFINGWYDECLLALDEPLRNDLSRLEEISDCYMNEFFGWKIDYFYIWLNNYFIKIINALFTLEKVILIPFLKGRINEFNFDIAYYNNIINSLDKISEYKEQLKMNLGKNIIDFRLMVKQLCKDISFYLDYKETVISDILKQNFRFINKNIFVSIVKYNSNELNGLLIPWIIKSYSKWSNDEKKNLFINQLPKKTRNHLRTWMRNFNKTNDEIYEVLSHNERMIKKCCSCI